MLDCFKTLAETVFYIAGTIGTVVAVITYWRSQRLEQAKWASSLFDKFYVAPDHKSTRIALDCLADSKEVAEMVERERVEFTDYLNFFEHVAYLVRRGQISRPDAEAYFGYYLLCLKRHKAVQEYVRNKINSYELLEGMLWS